MAFKFLLDRPRGTLKYSTPASTAIVLGQPLKVSSNALAAISSGNTTWCLAQGTKASSDSATTPIEVVPLDSSVLVVDVGTGTMANSYVGSTCDVKSGATQNIDLTADTNHDVTIVGWDGVDTTKAYVVWNKSKLVF